MLTRSSKRKLQEDTELQTASKCTKNIGMDPEISAQMAKIETESQDIKNEGIGKCEKLQDKSVRFEDFPAEILLQGVSY